MTTPHHHLLARCVDRAGGVKSFATSLGVHVNTVSGWHNGGKIPVLAQMAISRWYARPARVVDVGASVQVAVWDEAIVGVLPEGVWEPRADRELRAETRDGGSSWTVRADGEVVLTLAGDEAAALFALLDLSDQLLVEAAAEAAAG